MWKQILDQKAAGRAVLLISAELDEIYALSDRIVTLYEGKITGEFPPDAPPEEIGVGMLGGAKEAVGVDGHRRRGGARSRCGRARPGSRASSDSSSPCWPRFVIALLAGSLLIVAYGENPARGLLVDLRRLDGIGRRDRLRPWRSRPRLIFSALAVAVCFKGGLFNIGVEGQYLFAMVMAAWAEVSLGFLPAPILLVGVLIAAMLGGMIWAAVPGHPEGRRPAPTRSSRRS